MPDASPSPHADLRFRFGENWARFLRVLTPQRIEEAERSLAAMLGRESFEGLAFLDAGSGSGLFSLAARRRGARVRSFDVDPQSVACTQELKRRFFPEDPAWLVEQGSVLDQDYLASLGQFDVVYSWGVLHHTGNMRQAMSNVAALVRPGGLLYLAIYNDQGRTSHVWRWVKRLYNSAPRFLRPPIVGLCAVRLWGPAALRDLFTLRPFRTWRTYDKNRGMSPWHDLLDWVGGYPFEVARPEEIFDFFRDRGFELVRLKTCGGGLGCNEYVFLKNHPHDST